ncbi:MAG: ATP-binding cassette domain-containing protein [Methanoregulaceae archaeon]|nr:ATP-binding cassette domain-containing protein [Methanoregulaceae archaeon]
MTIADLTVTGGRGKDGRAEPVSEITLRMGDIVSIVGPTGCGKTTLINDIELFANRNTPSGRRVLINGESAEESCSSDPARNPIALISQHTNFLSDLPVEDFLSIHATVRAHEGGEAIRETLGFANKLTGEPIIRTSAMTELSGGQTRALLIADAVVIGNSPIVLLDEIENAGIHRTRALELLKEYRKIFVFVTHDPRIALLSDYRVVMRNGAMQEVILTGKEEGRVAAELRKMDDLILDFRNRIRLGERLTENVLEEQMKACGYLT